MLQNVVKRTKPTRLPNNASLRRIFLPVRPYLRIEDAYLHSSSSSFFLLLIKRALRARGATQKAARLPQVCSPTLHLHTSHLSPCPILLRIDDACLHFASSSFFFIIKGRVARPRRAPTSYPSALIMPTSHLCTSHLSPCPI